MEFVKTENIIADDARDKLHGKALDGRAEQCESVRGRDADDARDAERTGQAADARDDLHGDQGDAEGMSQGDQDGRAELQHRGRQNQTVEVRGRAEHDGRAVNTQTARQSPTTPGAVARYCTNPLVNVYDNIVTNSNLGRCDKPEHELWGQAEQDSNFQRGREGTRSQGNDKIQDTGCQAEPMSGQAEQYKCRAEPLQPKPSRAEQERRGQAEQVGSPRRGAGGCGQAEPLCGRIEQWTCQTTPRCDQAEHITCRAEPSIGRAEQWRRVENKKNTKWR